MDNLTSIKEFARIIRGEHPAWRGDKRYNAGCFLRQIREASPDCAAALAFDIECNLDDYSKETGLPHRTLEQAQRVLFGIWAGL